MCPKQSRSAHDSGADIVEIRTDLLDLSEQTEWHRLLPALTLPAIVTNRPKWEGGQSEATELERLGVLVDAIKRGASHIDVEFKTLPVFIDLCRNNNITFPLEQTKLIVSHHDFEQALPEGHITDLIASMRRAGANICKIAMMARSAMDNFTVFRTLRRANRDCIIIAMGDLGQVSRIAAGKFGAYLTFASVSSGAESAPGQVDVQSLVNLYRFRTMTDQTAIYGVIGDPVSHSMSPAVHNVAMRAASLNSVYVPLRVTNDVPNFVEEAFRYGFRGFSVTIPAKISVIAAMNEMDDVASRIGAMNTVVQLENGRLKGFNTDWMAAISAIEEKFSNGIYGKRVICIGAGGAGRALAFGALERGAEHVIVVNRSLDKAVALADSLGGKASAVSLEQFNEGACGKYDVLMNTTSVGMHPKSQECPIEVERLITGTVVFDAVYNPLETRLLEKAKECGCIPVSGLEMFVRQAAEQLRLWFPEMEPPLGTMREVVLERLGEKSQKK